MPRMQAVSMNITKWQMETSSGEWADMAPEQQLGIRTAIAKAETVMHFRARGFPYEIDLKEGYGARKRHPEPAVGRGKSR